MSQCQVHIEDWRRNHCHLKECKIVDYVLTLVDNIRLQVVGELIIKNSKPLSVTAFFVVAMAQEAIQYST